MRRTSRRLAKAAATEDEVESVKFTTITAEIKVEEVRPARSSKIWIFITGAYFLLMAWILAPVIKTNLFIPYHFSNLSQFLFENTLNQYLPDGKFADDVIANLTSVLKPFWFKSEFGELGSPGLVLKAQGAKAHFPVLLIPGIISTGLELWEGKECAKPYFRERFWGTLTMLKALLMDGDCWQEHMRLDPDTGLDPEGVRIRPAQGLEAADFLLPGFWVWARIIENLAELGYDHSNLQMAPYDWRLNIINLEKRDHYMTKLKNQVELMKKINGKKLVIATHSLGGCVWHYFMKWVEADIPDGDIQGGGGGKNWVNDHIEAVVHIGAPFLGLPKSLGAIISGECRETAVLGKVESYVLDLLLSRTERVNIFRTWTGGLGILPKGGNHIWGSKTEEAVDLDIDGKTVPLVTKVDKEMEILDIFYADDVKDICEKYLSPGSFKLVQKAYSTGMAKSEAEIIMNDQEPRSWMNPLESRLPFAPDMKLYCFHGVGKHTERGYIYKETKDHIGIDMIIDIEKTDISKGNLFKGVYRSEGDGTVPLLSLGYMPFKGWTTYSELNPAKIPIVMREYLDDISNLRVTDVRGGPKSGDHVDILGNHELTLDLLRIAANVPEEGSPDGFALHERILSNIKEIADKIHLNFKK